MRRSRCLWHTEARRLGAAGITVPLLILAITVCGLGGFYFGRNVLGAQYLRMGAVKIKARPGPYLGGQRRSAPAPPIIEEPQAEEESRHEEAFAAPRPRRHVATPPRATAPTEPEGKVTLRLGTYLKSENAKALVRDLRNRGYAPTVTVEKDGQSTLHKVEMGPLSPEQAQSLASDLQREGYKVGVVQKK
jgi:cell division septation protein DedD